MPAAAERRARCRCSPAPGPARCSCIGVLAAPAVRGAAEADAGRSSARCSPGGLLSLALAVLLLVGRAAPRRDAAEAAGSVLRAEMLLLARRRCSAPWPATSPCGRCWRRRAPGRGPAFAALHARRSAFFGSRGCSSSRSRGGWPAPLTAPDGRSAPAAHLLDAGGALLARLSYAAGGDAHVAEHGDLLDLRPVVAALRELQDLDDAGPGMRSSRSAFSFGATGATAPAACRCAGSARRRAVGQLREPPRGRRGRRRTPGP